MQQECELQTVHPENTHWYRMWNDTHDTFSVLTIEFGKILKLRFKYPCLLNQHILINQYVTNFRIQIYSRAIEPVSEIFCKTACQITNVIYEYSHCRIAFIKPSTDPEDKSKIPHF